MISGVARCRGSLEVAEILLCDRIGQDREPPADVGEKVSQPRACALFYRREPLRFCQTHRPQGGEREPLLW